MPTALKKCELSYQKIIPCLKSKNLLQASGKDSSAAFQMNQGSGILRTDSRKIAKGDIFLAYKGVTSDGHLHIRSAIERGAAFIVLEDKTHLDGISPSLIPPWAEVSSGRAAWTELASLAYQNPEKSLNILGVTGTNGKTSTVWMTAEILRGMGIPCLTIGTLGARLGDEEFQTGHTTPDPDLLFSLLNLAKERGVKVIAMEVSSHSLVQEKVRGLLFSACAFTSFSRDHLDFHPTMNDYWLAKWRLFTDHLAQGAPCFFADGLGKQLNIKSLQNRSVIYGFAAKKYAEQLGAADFLEISVEKAAGLLSTIGLATSTQKLFAKTTFFGKHALENLAVAALLVDSIIGHLPSSDSLSHVRPVPGRLEPVQSSVGPHVVVDYAHTPDALEKTIAVLRAECKGQLIVVFGCGGDRDPGKRPMMGRVAFEHADKIVVTSDNPRTEHPEKIIDDILSGLPPMARSAVDVYPDRKIAIEKAILSAAAHDLVLIAGKGHENYQIIGHIKHDFDDRLVAHDAVLLRSHK